jgi:hypothetical protein
MKSIGGFLLNELIHRSNVGRSCYLNQPTLVSIRHNGFIALIFVGKSYIVFMGSHDIVIRYT